MGLLPSTIIHPSTSRDSHRLGFSFLCDSLLPSLAMECIYRQTLKSEYEGRCVYLSVTEYTHVCSLVCECVHTSYTIVVHVTACQFVYAMECRWMCIL